MKKHNILLFIILFSFSCVCEISEEKTRNDFIAEQGFRIFTNKNIAFKDQIEEAIDLITVNIFKRIPNIYQYEKLLSLYKNEKFEIYIVKESFKCFNNSKMCNGLYVPNKFMKYVNKYCIGESALVHEMLHFLGHKIENNLDSNHEKKEFFNDKNSLEKWTNRELMENFCVCY